MKSQTDKERPKAYWVVWREGGSVPTKKHATRADAEQEAMRLARLYPRSRFVVLVSQIAVMQQPLPVEVTYFSGEGDD